jgi:hypothetical protein
MSEKQSVLKSIFSLKCSRCRKGDLFIEKNTYAFKNLFNMHEKCPHCGLNYELEVGFFYGSMYVSYGLAVAISVAIFVAMLVFSLLLAQEINFTLYLILNSLALLAAAPYMYRFSRAVWLYMFVKYAPQERGKFIKKAH